MNLWVIAAGVLAGLGVFALVRELLPGAVRLDAALRRLDPAAGWMGAPVSLGFADYPAAAPADGQEGDAVRRIGGQLAALAPWLPVPATDLALLGRDRESWLASKLGFGLAGLAIIPLAAVALALNGARIPVALPAFASVLLGVGMFFLPDLSVRLAARGRRADFRHALASYLDLVSLERGAGAGPTEALEAAAEIGAGWAFNWRHRAGRPCRHRRGGRPGGREDPADSGRPCRIDAGRGARRRARERRRQEHDDGGADRAARRRLPDPDRLPADLPDARFGMNPRRAARLRRNE